MAVLCLFNKHNLHYFRLRITHTMSAASVQTREVDTSSALVQALALRLKAPASANKRQRVESALSARIRASQGRTAQQSTSKTPMMRMRE